ncbi:hypothetical protein DRQ09_09805, partial [candidate division KSB1 bacterium]
FLLFFSIIQFSFLIEEKKSNEKGLKKLSIIDYKTFFDANNIKMIVTNVGSFCYELLTNTSGLEYPKGSGKTAIFAAGVIAGGIVNGELRMANSTYNYEYSPGNIIGYNSETGEVEYANPGDDKWHVLKLNKEDTSENPDYNIWIEMEEFGAPVDADGKPLITGDQSLWAVFNDANKNEHKDGSGGTLPLNIEIQSLVFGFTEPVELSNAVYIKLKLLNKGNFTIKDFYFSFWADPDLGDPQNDRVGVDVDKNLAFIYNDEDDRIYGTGNICCGIDLLKGLKNDSGELLHLTAFSSYLRGMDPNSPLITYNYMRGFNGSGGDFTNPLTGNATKFLFSGDPVKGTGWIDTYPGDKRVVVTSGPVTFKPDSSMDFIVAIVFGMHNDYLKAISAMKYNDYFVKEAFEKNFKLPSLPPVPEVTAFAGEDEIYLYWDDKAESYYENGYEFQGYNVYVSNRENAINKFDWKIVNTYDKIDGIKEIKGIKFDERTGDIEEGVVIRGTDSGLKRWKKVISDEWASGGKSLIPEKDYYYAVTSYACNPSAEPEYLESTIVPVKVTPGAAPPGYDYSAVLEGMPKYAEHSKGNGTGEVRVYLVNPDEVKQGDYKVTFSGSPENEDLVWSLLKGAEVKILNNKNFSGDWNYPVVNGIQVVVKGKNTLPETYSDVKIGGNIKFGLDISTWYPSGRVREIFGKGGEKSIPYLGKDIEIRFTADIDTSGYGETGHYIIGTDGGSFANYYTDFYGLNSVSDDKVRIPFEVWDIEDNYQINCIVFNREGTDIQWEWGKDEYIVVIHKPYDPIKKFHLDDPYTTWCFRLASDSGVPEKGDYIRLIYDEPLREEDEFTFTTASPIKGDIELAKNMLKNIRVVPNPYYGFSKYEVSYRYRIIKFINLPVEPCIIRIFNLYGTLIKTIVKDTRNTRVDWDLKSDYGNAVASGVYIYHIYSPLYG